MVRLAIESTGKGTRKGNESSLTSYQKELTGMHANILIRDYFSDVFKYLLTFRFPMILFFSL